MLGGPLGSTDCKLLGSDEGIKLGLSVGKVIGTILWNVDGIILGIDVETDLGSLYGCFDGNNDVKLNGLLTGDWLGYTNSEIIGSYSGVKLGLFYGNVIVTILVNVYGITLGLDVGTELGSLDGLFDGSNYGKLEGLFIVG